MWWQVECRAGRREGRRASTGERTAGRMDVESKQVGKKKKKKESRSERVLCGDSACAGSSRLSTSPWGFLAWPLCSDGPPPCSHRGALPSLVAAASSSAEDHRPTRLPDRPTDRPGTRQCSVCYVKGKQHPPSPSLLCSALQLQLHCSDLALRASGMQP